MKKTIFSIYIMYCAILIGVYQHYSTSSVAEVVKPNIIKSIGIKKAKPVSIPVIQKVVKYTQTKIVTKNLNSKLKKFNRKWSSKNKRTAIAVLKAGENEFNIDHRLVLSFMAHESWMKIYAYRKNTNKTSDYGLTQQNSSERANRYKSSEKILKKYKIKYTKSKYDVAKNIMSCYFYLSDIRKRAKRYDAKMIIMAYHLGIRGASLKKRRARGERYFNKIISEYSAMI